MKMRKLMSLLSVTAVVLSLVACGSETSATRGTGNNISNVNDVVQSQIDGSTEVPEGEDSSVSESAVSGSAVESGEMPADEAGAAVDVNNIDVDLTKLSSTVVYSEVFNITNTPEQYIGKTIKMSGFSATYHDENDGNDYYACIIPDATACCSQGIEYKLVKEEKYPEAESTITVVGRFEPYQINDTKYYTLKDAELVE